MNVNLENFHKIKYQRMPELVKEQLMDWIMDGTISMGEKLIAEDIAVRLGVSRMPVREALKSMEKSGIVITSYSIHYTKLYDNSRHLKQNSDFKFRVKE